MNIAARLESNAEPGGIRISSSVYDHVRGKVAVEFADLGEQNLKNIDRLVRVYAVISVGLARRHKRGAHKKARFRRLVFPSLCCRLPTSAAIQRKTTSSMA